MLLSLLSIVVVTLAYPNTDTGARKLLTDTTTTTNSKSLTTLKPEDIAINPNGSFSDGKCHCVPYYLCDEIDSENEPTDTLSIDKGCENVLELCCLTPKLGQPTIPKERSCGYRNPQGLQTFPSRNSSNSGETPWVVALMVGNTTVGGGALVHPQVVLTAAHVAEKYSNNTLVVRAGEWYTQTDKRRLKPQEGPVEKIKIHTSFHKANLMYDIALLRLQTPMKLADNIDVICLPDQDEDFAYSRGCIVNAWEKGDSGAVRIKKVWADILDSESCNAKLKRTRLGKWFKLHKSFVCAEEKQGFTCTGDGGAPLVCPGEGAHKVCGLVAWGIGCGDDIPAVYTRVAMFRKWVDDTMKEWGFGAEEWA